MQPVLLPLRQVLPYCCVAFSSGEHLSDGAVETFEASCILPGLYLVGVSGIKPWPQAPEFQDTEIHYTIASILTPHTVYDAGHTNVGQPVRTSHLRAAAHRLPISTTGRASVCLLHECRPRHTEAVLPAREAMVTLTPPPPCTTPSVIFAAAVHR